ncbi:MAG: DUF5320 domain-containing protein [Candidatus Pacebacteria bacterium]|nr:DUF5320 domain-containing protein [Candidatus Paceibacterota bacterium]
MPGFNRTGPTGQGSMTGRGFGPCGMGLGWRRRFGRGRGMGRYFSWSWPQTKADKKKALTQYKKALLEEMEDVDQELTDL